MKMRTTVARVTFGVCSALLLLSGCGNEVDCLIRGDNVRGRVSFASGIEIVSSADIVVEWSQDGFSSVGGRSRQRNNNGLVNVPYSMCANDGVALSFRAYQDLDNDATLDAGENSGRFDGTGDGDAAFQSRTIPESTEQNWETIEAIDIAVDT